jgi:hypothetical protein
MQREGKADSTGERKNLHRYVRALIALYSDHTMGVTEKCYFEQWY